MDICGTSVKGWQMRNGISCCLCVAHLYKRTTTTKTTNTTNTKRVELSTFCKKLLYWGWLVICISDSLKGFKWLADGRNAAYDECRMVGERQLLSELGLNVALKFRNEV